MRQEKNGCKTNARSLQSISSHSSMGQDAFEHDLQVIPPAWVISQLIGDGVRPSNTGVSMGRAEI